MRFVFETACQARFSMAECSGWSCKCTFPLDQIRRFPNSHSDTNVKCTRAFPLDNIFRYKQFVMFYINGKYFAGMDCLTKDLRLIITDVKIARCAAHGLDSAL